MKSGTQKAECIELSDGELSDGELGSIVGGKDSGLVRLGKDIMSLALAHLVGDGDSSPKSLTHY
jgi:hypothetical protein